MFALASALLSLLAITAQALPTSDVALKARQLQTTSDEVINGPCRPIAFIFARGTNIADSEPGNMGQGVGPQLCSAIKARFGAANVACQGVNYPAAFLGNVSPRGTPQAGINEGARLYRLVASQCPQTQIISGGYSQGAALIAASTTDVALQSPAVAARIAGVALFGSTRNVQDMSGIPSFPRERVLAVCNEGDRFCEDNLPILAQPHLEYAATVPRAVEFYAARLA